MRNLKCLFNGCFAGLLLLPVLAAATTSIPECTKNKPAITVTKTEPNFMVRLVSNASTGYRWFLRDEFSGIKPLNAKYSPPAKNGLVGTSGEEVWQFHANAVPVPRQYIIHFAYARPFEIGAAAGFACQVPVVP